MKANTKIAMEKFLAGYNCAQAVLYAFCDDLQFDKDAALKLACGFGAGMARKQEICGALSGGIIAIGLQYGRGEGQDRVPTEQTYRKVRELISRFESIHGTSLCRTLLHGCDLNTLDGRQYFKDKDFLNTICWVCVKTAVEALEEIL
ncbi:MAG: C-GCAxxG-C-C family protein [Desulfocapsaceae bacterium]|nr:C-GCAxxG-C-C family protein [Desulfocapsaceae bacterium]